MAISRSQMRRQLSNRGGITNLSPRQNFGLGSKLKRAVRKIIPNEVSKVASAAAPFVAPFNPALAAGMAGIGSFDQTGSISDALKRGALTYGGGQAARYIGGAGFQGNPFQGDVLGNFTSFSSPLGTETGLGKMFEQRRVANIGKDLKEIGEVKPLGYEASEMEIVGSNIPKASEMEIVGGLDKAKENIFQRIMKDPSVSNIGNEAVNLAKQAGKAIFYDKDGNLDKNVLLGTIAFTASYAEAASLADEVGVDLTEAEYNEARKAEKQEQYAADLQNFFAGKKEGGRIGFANGTEDMTMIETLTEDPFAEGVIQRYVSDEMGALPKIMKDGDGGVLPSDMGMLSRADFKTDEDYNRYLEVLTKMTERDEEAEGGRQGFLAGMLVKEGIKKLGKIIFSPAEKTFLFKNLGKLGGSDRSQTFPNLFKILKDPSKFPKDAKALKAFIELRMKKAGGGIMDIPVRTNKAGVQELDMRSSGGFVPIGVKEKADDVPAMLSKNEFVLTADAVRGIGGGSVEKGSEKLYNLMKTAENVGRA
jgi:hypothetical protein